MELNAFEAADVTVAHLFFGAVCVTPFHLAAVIVAGGGDVAVFILIVFISFFITADFKLCFISTGASC
jgi:hypothetical protein